MWIKKIQLKMKGETALQEKTQEEGVERRVDVLGRRNNTAIRLFLKTITTLKHITPNNASCNKQHTKTHTCARSTSVKTWTIYLNPSRVLSFCVLRASKKPSGG
jgi:hypothetical protein